jgi:LysM repeat protein
VQGEWLEHIARCYGANYEVVRGANSTVTDPHQLSPGTIVSVPNIGSDGTIYGPPCIQYHLGETIQHTVVAGEWLWQIARCYGADPKQVVQDNPLPDPTKLRPGTIVTVRNVGSKGISHGPPCVGTHTVQSGETWASIAQLHNADTLLLQEVNPGALSLGRVLKVPLYSAGNR